MELRYLELIEEHKLRVSDLPEDAKTGIDNINAIVTAVKMAEKKGRRINASTFKKLEVFDKWVCLEIMDFVNDTTKNNTVKPDATAIIKDIKEGAKGDGATTATKTVDATKSPDAVISPEKQKGLDIEAELAEMLKNGNTSLSLEQIKPLAPKAYSLIFDSYEEGGKNGIETTHYSLLETEKEKFTLTKK